MLAFIAVKQPHKRENLGFFFSTTLEYYYLILASLRLYPPCTSLSHRQYCPLTMETMYIG